MKKIILISATTIVIGITSFAYFGSKSPLQNEAKAVESQKHSNHPKEEIPAFPKADHNAKKLDDNFSVVTNPDSALVLVNKHRKLPDGYIPEDLTKPERPFTSPKDRNNSWQKCCRHLKKCSKTTKERRKTYSSFRFRFSNANSHYIIHILNAKEKLRLIR